MAELFLPHLYQFKAIAACLNNRFHALFLSPSLGKTAIMLWTFIRLQQSGRAKSMLVVAPLRVSLSVWQQEVKKWSFSEHLVVRTLHGDMKEWQLSQPADIYVINYEGLKWLLNTTTKGARKLPMDVLVLDESSKVKNPTSKTLKILKKHLLRFRRRYILNGTPAPKGYIDLWGQYLMLDNGRALGHNITAFRKSYLESDYMGYNWSIRSDEAADQIQKAVAPITLVMDAKDYLKMPKLSFPARRIYLPPKVMTHYREVEQELFTDFVDIEVELEVKNLAVASMMCRQIASGAFYEPLELEDMETPPPANKRVAHQVHDLKIAELMSLIEELQGQPLLVAYDFWHSYDRIRKAIKKNFGFDVKAINSDTTAKQGLVYEKMWNAGELRVLLGHPSSVSHGLNLQQSGGDICWYDGTWSLDTFIQYVQRVYRQGNDKPVRVHQIIATNTVDEVMLGRLKDKHMVESDLKTKIKHYRNIQLES